MGEPNARVGKVGRLQAPCPVFSNLPCRAFAESFPPRCRRSMQPLNQDPHIPPSPPVRSCLDRFRTVGFGETRLTNAQCPGTLEAMGQQLRVRVKRKARKRYWKRKKAQLKEQAAKKAVARKADRAVADAAARASEAVAAAPAEPAATSSASSAASQQSGPTSENAGTTPASASTDATNDSGS